MHLHFSGLGSGTPGLHPQIEGSGRAPARAGHYRSGSTLGSRPAPGSSGMVLAAGNGTHRRGSCGSWTIGRRDMDNTTRNTPPLLMGAVLVFWGWQIGYLVLGLSAAIVLEGGRALRWRWELAEVDYRRIWDLCVIVTGILFLFFYGSEDWTRTAFTFAKWLPLVFLPMAMAQWFGSREQIG